MLVTDQGCSCAREPVRKAGPKKPAYVDGKAVFPEQKDAFAIARRFEAAMASAYGTVFSTFWNDETQEALIQALIEGLPPHQAVEALQFYNPGNLASNLTWEPAFDRLDTTYGSIIAAARDAAIAELNIPIASLAGILPMPDFSVRPDSRSLRWIRERTAEMVVNINNEQRLMTTSVIRRGYTEGIRPKALANEISDIVGLTEREAGWVAGRRRKMQAQGLSDIEINKASEAFSEKLLKDRGKRIARTEAKMAQSQGQLDTWQELQDAGLINENTEKEWVAFLSPRTSDICTALDGQRMPLNVPFYSTVLGAEVDRPPAHPNCRSVMRLILPDE